MHNVDFRGFNSDTTSGDWLEVVFVWLDEIYDVEHVRIGDPLPPMFPPQLAKIVATGVDEPTRVEAAPITCYVRRVAEPVPVDAPEKPDWNVAASLGLILLVTFALGVVFAVVHFLPAEEATAAPTHLPAHRHVSYVQADEDNLPGWWVKLVVPREQAPVPTSPPRS